ncbi:hypothetical protein PVAG01_11210 [Phlyctema vagabunda]|uniref:Uncharacterized protein n=1 Tax=Phlyctema vagabunda TaxID=108571 RepID=A0ABR4P1N0_9HELO
MGDDSYSVPVEARKVLDEGILRNPLVAKYLPSDVSKYAQRIRYTGRDEPSIPINWRFAESIAALKGLEATALNILLKKKYDIEPEEVIIDTDHASLFIMSTLIWVLDPQGEKLTISSAENPSESQKLARYLPSVDLHRHQATFHRASTTNIYKTKDERFFHLHGSMNPDPSLDCIGLPHEMDAASVEDSWIPFQEKISQLDSQTLQNLASKKYKQAGTICYTKEEYASSAHGKANSHVGLFEIHNDPSSKQPPSWWPSTPLTSARRPLAGLKVLDITRVIAAPSITRGLAEMGASVMRVTSPNLVDYSTLHCDLNWGKWNCHLDFTKEEDREALRKLILEADVVVEGYRPGVLDKYGLGRENVLKLCKDRSRGVIFARENCYGWNGEWSDRSGWQQISDACCGVSMEFGRAMGHDEPVTPVFPNSDYCTGVAGTSAILLALLQRAEFGGSYSIDIALNYYSSWLINSCGVYPDKVWQALWSKDDRFVFRHFHNMLFTLPKVLGMLARNGLFKDEFFELRKARHLGVDIRCVKPILTYKNKEVELGYQVGTRGNGVDRALWPKDLGVEVVV